MYLAHLIFDEGGIRREQTLKDHNRQVGLYAAECLGKAGLSSCGMLAGILHDGKGTRKFQQYLDESARWEAYDRGYAGRPDFPRPKRGSVVHTFAGCIYLLEAFHGSKVPGEKYTAEFLACAIASHHGLFDCLSIEQKNGFLHRLKETNREDIQYESARDAFEQEVASGEEIRSLFHQSVQEFMSFLNKTAGMLSKEGSRREKGEIDLKEMNLMISMAERMLTSALIYADRRDTAEFADRKKGEYGDSKPDWSRDIKDFEQIYSQLPPSVKPIDQIRTKISYQCKIAAEEPDGRIYQLNVPTGGGKTLSSLRYALYHGERYQKSRVIYVIPLLTIIDQNAAEIRHYLPSEKILEHHSDIFTDQMSEQELVQYDLMKDRWNAPVIVTTLVQVLDILFCGKTQSIARMRALSDAVIIFDEVQSVPGRMVTMFNAALNYLAKCCRSTVILCSATQPTFEEMKGIRLMLTPKSMVSVSNKEMEVFRRCRYHEWDGRNVPLEEVCQIAMKIAETQNPLMIVCNIKSQAARLYQMLSDQREGQNCIMHLSAGMCKAHRRIVLDQIAERLREFQSQEDSQKMILVTTQIVEAGVNLSFRAVIRLMAGDDNLVQTAGRCNRSDEYHGEGDVYLMKVQGERLTMLPEIARAQEAMTAAMTACGQGSFDPTAPRFIRSYYHSLFAGLERDNETGYPFRYKNSSVYYIADLLGNGLSPKTGEEDYMMRQPFKTTGEYFKVFAENTITVLVPYRAEGEKLIGQIQDILNVKGVIPAKVIRKAGDYSVTLYDWQKKKLEEAGMLIKLADGLVYVLERAAYREDIGLDIASERCVEDFMY